MNKLRVIKIFVTELLKREFSFNYINPKGEIIDSADNIDENIINCSTLILDKKITTKEIYI